MEKNRMFSKLTEAQKTNFLKPDGLGILHFVSASYNCWQMQCEKNETVLEEALKKDLGKSAFESYATEIGFVLADIRYTIQNLQKWSAPKRVKNTAVFISGQK